MGFASPQTSKLPLNGLKVFIYDPIVCLSSSALDDPRKLEVCLLYFRMYGDDYRVILWEKQKVLNHAANERMEIVIKTK